MAKNIADILDPKSPNRPNLEQQVQFLTIVLLNALPALLQHSPDAKRLFAFALGNACTSVPDPVVHDLIATLIEGIQGNAHS